MEHGEESLSDLSARVRDAKDALDKLTARRDALIFDEHRKGARPLELQIQTQLTESRLNQILRKQREKGGQ
jgi:hypothetical protein